MIKIKQNNFNYDNIVFFSKSKLLSSLNKAILNEYKFECIIIKPYIFL